MKSVGELFIELGFNKDAPLETQKAFLKHLITAANQSTNGAAAKPQVEIPKAQKVADETARQELKSAQLEFDFSDTKRVS